MSLEFGRSLRGSVSRPDRLWSVLAAASWTAAYLAIHLPRGWPFDARGEWDLLLPALAMAGGEAPPAVIGAIHGPELGSYLWSWLLSVGLRLGMDPVLAAKLLLLAIGGFCSGLCAGWAARLGTRRAGLSGGHVAGGVVATVLALSWPGWHFELMALNGRTPEAVPFQLLAVAAGLAFFRGAGASRTAVAGAALGLGWLMSPVILWTGACLLVLLLLSPRRLEGLGSALVGALSVFVLYGLLVPGGWEGLGLFVSEQFGGGLGVVGGGGSRPVEQAIPRPGLGLVAMSVAGALEGGAHNDGLVARSWSLPILAWAMSAACAWSLLGAARARRMLQENWIALFALSWMVPLSALPLDRWFYPLAYRYWVVPLLLASLVLGVELARLCASPRFRIPAVVLTAGLLVLASLPLPSLGQSILAPAVSRSAAVAGTGAHRMGPRPDRERHAAFRALYPHSPQAVRVSLAEGYGLALGADAAELAGQGGEPPPVWNELRGELQGAPWRGLLRGMGCGLAFRGPPVDLAADAFAGLAPPDHDELRFGTRHCLGEEPSRSDGESFTAKDPQQLLPDRL